MVDIRNLLKKYNSFIYTGDRKQDLFLMRDEIKSLYENKLITIGKYNEAILIIRKELRELNV